MKEYGVFGRGQRRAVSALLLTLCLLFSKNRALSGGVAGVVNPGAGNEQDAKALAEASDVCSLSNFESSRGYILLYDASLLAAPIETEGPDVFLPAAGIQAEGVSFAVYEIGYDAAATLPGGVTLSMEGLDLGSSALYHASVLADRMREAGYDAAALELEPGVQYFDAACTMGSKEGACAVLYVVSLASGTFCAVAAYPQALSKKWSTVFDKMTESMAGMPGI